MIDIISPAFLTYPILVPSLICQTSDRWRLQICHDGQNDYFKYCMSGFQDKRIIATETTEVTGYWGHRIRHTLVDNLVDEGQYIIITNHDNYMIPNLIERVELQTEDMVFWDIVHNYYGYNNLSPKIEHSHIDISQVAIKCNIVKKVGWKWFHNSGDYDFIQACWLEAKTYKFMNILGGIHN
jgi:hypothetical protein